MTDQSDTDGGELTGGIPTPPLRTAATSEPNTDASSVSAVAAPSNRVPVRVARGTKSALEVNFDALQQGELSFARDQNSLYIKDGKSWSASPRTSAISPNTWTS